MTRYEYKVVPAPAKGEKAKGVKTPEARFALSVQSVLNRMGAEGWEYLRADLLPSEERSGLTGSAMKWRNLLVFRRVLAEDLDAFAPELLAPPEAGPAAEPSLRADPPVLRAASDPEPPAETAAETDSAADPEPAAPLPPAEADDDADDAPDTVDARNPDRPQG